jgi:glycine/D-amino acid oxidase-like deaminating enzyme
VNSKRSIDTEYILVGQGLAGSILALELLRKGRTITVFDTPDRNCSSIIAAGMFNPVTGRKFIETWRAGEIFPYLLDYYPKLEEELNSKFFYPRSMFRPFLTDQEHETMLSIINSGSGKFFDRIIESFPDKTPYYNEFGGLFLKYTGYVNIPVLMNSIRDFIRPRVNFFEEFFDYKKLKIHSDRVSYRSFSATKIIFCEGYAAENNPLFNWIPFRAVKGDILYIQPEVLPGFIFNRQIFIIPWTDGTCRAGATYDWDYPNTKPSEKAKNYLLEKLNRFFLVNYRISGHVAGIRPATLDRRPVLGLHPELPAVGIFNGLGSKGVSLAPYFAGMFVDNLLYKTELDKEVDIIRFK